MLNSEFDKKLVLTVNAIKYTIKHLFMVAWPEILNEISIEVAADKLSAITTIRGKRIVFCISSYTEIDQLLNGVMTLNSITTADKENEIPVCLKENFPFAEINDDGLQVNADIISLSFIMLSRYEEKIVKERDSLDRFESRNSIAVKYNFIDFPIVDEYVLILQTYLKEYFPEQNFTIPECKIIPTHDIDEVRRFAGFKKTIRTLLGDIYLYKNIFTFFKSLKQCLVSINNPSKDPYLIAINELIKISDKFNLTSEFYFMGAQLTKYDCGYNTMTSSVQKMLTLIQYHGMIVGFHGGFYTSINSALFKKEKEQIEAAVGHTVVGGRQHYLRFDVNDTFDIQESCGMEYDSTLGYADREGFRCGTCHEFHPYDLKNDKAYKIKERPLIVMDATLYSYRGYSIEKAYQQMERLYKRCKAVGGNFVLLWHNNAVARETKWFKKVYCRFIENCYNV